MRMTRKLNENLSKYLLISEVSLVKNNLLKSSKNCLSHGKA